MEVLIQKKNLILDATLLSTLMSCPRLFDFRFNHDLQSLNGKSVSLEMGSIVHAGLENYYQNVINGIPKETSVANSLIAAKEYSLSAEVKNSSGDDISLALSTLEQYYEFYRNDHWTPLFVETTKGRVIYEDDEIRILWKAKFDLGVDTNAGIYPVDHKTMKQRRDTLSLNNQFMGQAILMNTRTVIINKVGFQTSLKPHEKFTRVPIQYSADRLLEWQSEILPYWAKKWLMYAESEYFPPNFTHCENKYGFCIMKEVCESDRNMREDTIKMNFYKGDKWDIGNEGKE